MGVFVAHIGVFMLLSHLQPKPPQPPKPAKPNFTVRSQAVVDQDSGEKVVYREITVSTRLTGTPPPVPRDDVR